MRADGQTMQSSAAITRAAPPNVERRKRHPPQPSWPGPSNISVFLRNLRLLDLDRREDSPELTLRTFSTKDAQQNLRQRVKAVEWSLYQLFHIWDPEETRNVSSCITCSIFEQPDLLFGIDRNYDLSSHPWSPSSRSIFGPLFSEPFQN